jgi:hypothetical protein
MVETAALMANQDKHNRTPDNFLMDTADTAEDSKPHSSPDRRKETCMIHQRSNTLEQLQAALHCKNTDLMDNRTQGLIRNCSAMPICL